MQSQQKNLEKQEVNKDLEEQKRLSKQLEDIQNPDVKPKKTIVVIGRMGHGKSSFIKMLVSQEDKPKIIASPQIESVTKQCSLYEICPQIKEKLQIAQKQKIYLMDTPGLNSNAKNYLIMDQIRRKLILQKCQVISILYIRQSTDFRQQDENDSIGMYLALPIPKKIKDKITTFILTNYDKQLLCQQQFEQFMNNLKQRYKKKNLDFLLDKNIRWISLPQKDKDKQKIQKLLLKMQQFKQAFQNQWKDLKQTLKSKQGEKFGYNQLTQLTGKFYQVWKQKFQKALQNQNQTQRGQVYFNFQTGDKQQLQKLKKSDEKVIEGWLGSVLGTGGLGIGLTLGSLFVTTQTTAAACVAYGLGFGMGGPIIATLIFLPFLINYGCKINRQRQKKAQEVVKQLQKLKNYKQLQKEKEQFQLQNLSLQYASNYCLNKLNMKAVGGGYLQFDFQTWIEQISVLNKQVNLKQNQIKKAMKWIYKQFKNDSQTEFKQTYYEKKSKTNDGVQRTFGYLRLEPENQYKFTIKIRRPTQKIIVDLVKQTTHEIYGK